MGDEDGSPASEFALLDADFSRTHREAEQPVNAGILDLEGEE